MPDFSRKNRLIKKEIDAVFTHAKKVNQNFVSIRYCENKLGFPRLGVIVPKAIIKKAVARNRLRRHIRESFRHHKEILKGLDIVVLIRSEWTAEKHALREEINKIWPRLVIVSKKV